MVTEEQSKDKIGGAYSDEGREDAVESGAMTVEEAGFVEGYQEGEKKAICAECKTELYEETIEREINGELYEFCSENHAELFAKRKEAEKRI